MRTGSLNTRLLVLQPDVRRPNNPGTVVARAEAADDEHQHKNCQEFRQLVKVGQWCSDSEAVSQNSLGQAAERAMWLIAEFVLVEGQTTGSGFAVQRMGFHVSMVEARVAMHCCVLAD